MQSLYELEYHLQNGDVYYIGHQIKPTFSYIISAHGVEHETQRIPWNDNYQSTLYFFARRHGDLLDQGNNIIPFIKLLCSAGSL